jgi:hypothetical protein
MELFIFPLAVIAVFIVAKMFLYFAGAGLRTGGRSGSADRPADRGSWERHLASLSNEQCDNKEWDNTEHVKGEEIPIYEGEIVYGNYPQRYFERQLSSGEE